jgi:hypothetical protein
LVVSFRFGKVGLARQDFANAEDAPSASPTLLYVLKIANAGVKCKWFSRHLTFALGKLKFPTRTSRNQKEESLTECPALRDHGIFYLFYFRERSFP